MPHFDSHSIDDLSVVTVINMYIHFQTCCLQTVKGACIIFVVIPIIRLGERVLLYSLEQLAYRFVST